MPRITEIGAMRRTNLGDYEHNEFSAKAVIDEGEDVAQSVAQLVEMVNWYSRKPINERHLQQKRHIVANTASAEVDVAKAQNWIDKYEEKRKRIEEPATGA